MFGQQYIRLKDGRCAVVAKNDVDRKVIVLLQSDEVRIHRRGWDEFDCSSRLCPKGNDEALDEGERAVSGSYVLYDVSDLTGIGVGRVGKSNADMVVLCCVVRILSRGLGGDLNGTI